MSFDDWAGLVIAILLGAYLVAVLVAPERF
jgi:K+-transporting ATPase KdpF subunit